MCHEYTVTRCIRRWPSRVFFDMLDQCAINAYILYCLNADNGKKQRSDFLENLSIDLIKPFLIFCLQKQTLRVSVHAFIEYVLQIDFSTGEIQDDILDYQLDKQVRCDFCPRKKDTKTKVIYPQMPHSTMQLPSLSIMHSVCCKININYHSKCVHNNKTSVP